LLLAGFFMVFFLCYPWFLLSSFAFFWNALQRYKNILLFANNLAKIRRFNISFSLKFCNKMKMWVRAPKMWGRREGERMSLTCLQPFIHRPLRGVMWVCEGHFRIPWFFAFDPSDNCLVHLKLAFSPINANSQSEGFGLVVRRERTVSPSGRTNLFRYTSYLL